MMFLCVCMSFLSTRTNIIATEAAYISTTQCNEQNKI